MLFARSAITSSPAAPHVAAAPTVDQSLLRPRLSPRVPDHPCPLDGAGAVWFGVGGSERRAAPIGGLSNPPVTLAGRRVLLAEDELMLALDVEVALQDEGAEVIGPIDDLATGLALLDRELALDAAVLDIDLHGEDVFPLAKRLRERGVPFLFHTGHGDRAALARHFAGVPVCTKPVLSERLVDAVKGLLA